MWNNKKSDFHRGRQRYKYKNCLKKFQIKTFLRMHKRTILPLKRKITPRAFEGNTPQKKLSLCPNILFLERNNFNQTP